MELVLAKRHVRLELMAATGCLQSLLVRDDKTQNATIGRNLNYGVIANNVGWPAHHSHHPTTVHKFAGRYFCSRPTAFAGFTLRRSYRHHLSFGCGGAASTQKEKYQQRTSECLSHVIIGRFG